MDTKNNNLAEELSKLIDDWRLVDREEDKITNIVKFICQNYNEKADNGWLEQISKHPLILRELFERNKYRSFKCSSGIKVEKDNKILGETEINDILGKMEKKELNLGYEFLLNKDEKHKELLAELNEKIRTWEMLHDKLNQKDEEKQIKDIAKFISNHYRTFVARLQQGVRQSLLKELFARDKKTGSLKYKKAHKSLKEAADRGLIFAVAKSIGCDNTFLVDPNDKRNKTLKIIGENFGDWMEKINVYAHAWGLFDETFHDKINSDIDFSTLALIPINNKSLSFISSRQTEGVENTCRIINYFTEKYLDENKKQMDVTSDEDSQENDKHPGKMEKKMDVILKGTSQGVDFITKMVCSTHGREDTRIKNANITLKIDSPHLFQDEQKIVKRLINGISDKKNNNTIENIFIKNYMEGWLHPKCRTDNLLEWLKYHQKELNNAKIKDLRKTRSKQQNAFY